MQVALLSVTNERKTSFMTAMHVKKTAEGQ